MRHCFLSPSSLSLAHEEELNFTPERFIYRCRSDPHSPPIIRFVGMFEARDANNSKNERKKGRRGRKKNIFDEVSNRLRSGRKKFTRFFFLLFIEERKEKKKRRKKKSKPSLSFEMTDMEIFCTRG